MDNFETTVMLLAERRYWISFFAHNGEFYCQIRTGMREEKTYEGKGKDLSTAIVKAAEVCPELKAWVKL